MIKTSQLTQTISVLEKLINIQLEWQVSMPGSIVPLIEIIFSFPRFSRCTQLLQIICSISPWIRFELDHHHFINSIQSFIESCNKFVGVDPIICKNMMMNSIYINIKVQKYFRFYRLLLTSTNQTKKNWLVQQVMIRMDMEVGDTHYWFEAQPISPKVQKISSFSREGQKRTGQVLDRIGTCHSFKMSLTCQLQRFFKAGIFDGSCLHSTVYVFQ